ncbi:MAG: hypothetical protein ABSG63_13250 [Spirochaetia bacterium]|jgi:hypothetical protein
MRKLVLSILALIALFSAIRASSEAIVVPGAGAGRGIQVHPGLVEFTDGSAEVGLAFGMVEKSAAQPGIWNLLPVRLVYRNGDKSMAVGLNGLSFLLRGGMNVGKPLRITTPRDGDVISIGGRVLVDAPVQGDVWTLGADIELTPRAVVSGDIVALGGKVLGASRAVVQGTISQVPQLKIPFLGVMGTQFSVQALGFGRQLLGYLLLGIGLFLSTYYLTAHARGLYHGLTGAWRPALVTLVISLVLVPLFAALLVVSVVGIFLLPVLAIIVALIALDGFLLLCARLGGLLRKAGGGGAGEDSLFLLSSGLLGLFLLKLPALAGIVLTMLRSDAAARAGDILQQVSLGLMAAGLLYGFGASLAHAHARTER